MIGSVPAGRRANAFAHILTEPRLGEDAVADMASDSHAVSELDTEQGALLSVVGKLEAVPGPELSPETKRVQRAQMVAAMEAAVALNEAGALAAPRPVPSPRGRSGRGAHRAVQASALKRLLPTSRLSRGLAAGGLTMGVAAGALGGATAASSNALPGDTLYGLKRGMEDLRLDFAGSDASRGQVHLDHASSRLNEARRLMERGKAGELDHEQLAEVRETLSSMSADASAGRRLLSEAHEADGSTGPLESLSSFSAGHRDVWAELSGQLPVQLSDVRDEVTSIFDAIDEDTTALSTLLSPASGADIPSDDARGHQPSEPPAIPPASPPASTLPDDPERQHGDSHGERAGEASPEHPEAEPEGVPDGTGLLPSDDTGRSNEPREPFGPGLDTTTPEITLPPLVEDLIPGLGLDLRQAD